MGSFLVSCGLSKMPIHEEERVKLLFLVENTEFKSIGSGKNYKVIFPFFVDGVYKDYGNFEIQANQNVITYMENYFKQKMVPTTHSRFNSDATSVFDKDSFKLDEIFNYIHDDALYLKTNIMYAFQRSKFTGIYADLTNDIPLGVQCMAIKSSILERLFDGVYDPYGTYEGGDCFGSATPLSFDDMRKNLKGEVDDDAIAYALCKTIFNTSHRTPNPVESLIDTESIEKIKDIVQDENLLVTIIVSERLSKEITSSKTLKYIKTLINDNNREALEKLCIYGNLSQMPPSEVRGCYEYKNHEMYTIAPFMDINSMVDFFVFDSWLGHEYHGCYTPTAYSGQNTSTYAHAALADIIRNVCDDEDDE